MFPDTVHTPGPPEPSTENTTGLPEPPPVADNAAEPPGVPDAGGVNEIDWAGFGRVVYAKWLAALVFEVPAGVVTVMVTVPAPGGLVTVICVLESAVMVAAAVPKRTPVAPARPVPVMVTVLPPPVLPLAGDTPVTGWSR